MLNSEARIQQDCLVWFTRTYCLVTHCPRCLMFSIPNEGENAWEVQKKVNTGLLRGASDAIVLLPEICLFMECKTEVGVQSEAQKIFQDRVQSLGFKYHIFRSLDQFQNIIKSYVSWPKEY